MKTINRKPDIRRNTRHAAARPEVPIPPAGLGEFAQKLDIAFREIAAGQVTVRQVKVTAPRDYSAIAVRGLREKMGVSQGVFAQLVGVSPETVENWEQGLIAPRPIARRLLDVIAANPAGYRATLLQWNEAGPKE